MESYIVRIYRRDRKHGREFVGIVEEVGVEGSRVFTNFEEHRVILAASGKTVRNVSPPVRRKTGEKR